MHAEICPICKGKGILIYGNVVPCHGCDGDGWVEVHDNNQEYNEDYDLPCMYLQNWLRYRYKM